MSGSVGLSVRRNRFIIFIKPSNYNGSALLHVVTKLRAVADNSLFVNRGQVGSAPPTRHNINVIFRSCTLCPRLSMTRGVSFNLGLTNTGGRIVGRHIGRITRILRLTRLLSHGPGTLSNNRHRHITVNHALITRPDMFLLSRPLSGLSTTLHIRVHVRVSHLRGHLNHAVVCIARSRIRTVALTSGVIILSTNHITRIKGPLRLCRCPTSHFITKFVNSPGVGFLPMGIATATVSRIRIRLPVPGHRRI